MNKHPGLDLVENARALQPLITRDSDEIERTRRLTPAVTSALIEKLMLLARSDSGVEALQFAPIDLIQNFREACRQGRTLAEAKQISFQEQIASLREAQFVEYERVSRVKRRPSPCAPPTRRC